jgi:hypothetical protein
MDDTLRSLIKKHAAANNINIEEANTIYRTYQLRINQVVDAMELTDIKEVRVPWLMRFTFNEKKYDKYVENRDKKQAKVLEKAKFEAGPYILGVDTV